MRKMLLIVIIILFSQILLASQFTNHVSNNCNPPTNPYNNGGGHDAGFEWAKRTNRDCNGNSRSFNEGCEEYYRQLHQYTKCLRNS